MNEGTLTFVVEGDYGQRHKDADFIKAIMREFDDAIVTGIFAFVNNHPYSLELYTVFWVTDSRNFENFLRRRYPEKSKVYNTFPDTLIDAVQMRGGNVFSFIDESDVDLAFSESGNGPLFVWPSSRVFDAKWYRKLLPKLRRVFLCHHSDDKHAVRLVRDHLNALEIATWFDEAEILIGDDIEEKLSIGLNTASCALFFLSKKFINTASKWRDSEIAFFTDKLRSGARIGILPLLIDIEASELPLGWDGTRAVALNRDEAMTELASRIRSYLTSP